MPRPTLLFSLAAFTVWIPIAFAQSPQPPTAPPITVDRAGITPNKPRTFDFTGESIYDVLRTLARAARMNIIVADGLEGVVNMRIEDKTPKEAMDIIIESQNLVGKEGKNGVYFIRAKVPAIRISEEEKRDAGKSSLTEHEPTKEDVNTFLPLLTGYANAMMDYQARPEVARKRAHAKKVLYDAYVAAGFSKEEALRLILTKRETSTLGSDE